MSGRSLCALDKHRTEIAQPIFASSRREIRLKSHRGDDNWNLNVARLPVESHRHRVMKFFVYEAASRRSKKILSAVVQKMLARPVIVCIIPCPFLGSFTIFKHDCFLFFAVRSPRRRCLLFVYEKSFAFIWAAAQ